MRRPDKLVRSYFFLSPYLFNVHSIIVGTSQKFASVARLSKFFFAITFSAKRPFGELLEMRLLMEILCRIQ